MKKTLAALALAGSVALIGSAPAMATYPAPSPSASTSTQTVAPGEAFTFSGEGMQPNEPVTITVTEEDAAAPAAGTQSVATKVNVFAAAQTIKTQADGEGRFSAEITINEAGTYSLLAVGDISGNRVGPITVVVDASLAAGGNGNAGVAPASSNGGLATTGADPSLILWTLVGAGALAAGAASVVVVRRKAKAEVAA